MAFPPSHSQSVLPNSKILLLESIERDENGFTLEVRSCQRPDARTVENSPVPATAIISANSRIFPGKGFPLEFVSKPAVFGAAIQNVGARYL